MPIYEFLCRCGHRFEKLCKASDPSFLQCPACGGESRRVISVFRVGRSADGAAGSAGFSTAGGGCSSCSRTSCAGCTSH